jgi:hypothetical protein
VPQQRHPRNTKKDGTRKTVWKSKKQMKVDEAESAIRSLAHQWHQDLPEHRKSQPSFESFTRWLFENGYGHYLDFRSTMGANYDAERWFDSALGQNWRR